MKPVTNNLYWVDAAGIGGKEYALTWGDLELYELQIEKLAEAIVVMGNEPRKLSGRFHKMMQG